MKRISEVLMAELFKSIQISIEPCDFNEVTPLISEAKCPEIPALFFLLLQQVQETSFRAGMEEAQKIMKQHETCLEALICNIPEAIAQHRWAIRDEIADIVLHITQQLFLHNQTDPKMIEAQINHILEQLKSLDTVELCLHPNDIALLQQGVITLNTKTQGLKITSTPNLQPGGCIVKSSHGVFDASIEGQMERLKQTLLSIKQGSSHASPH